MHKAAHNAYNAAGYNGRAMQGVSFLLHTIYGANVYPNYLAERFCSTGEAGRRLDEYEALLQRELARVHEAREARALRKQRLNLSLTTHQPHLNTTLRKATSAVLSSDIADLLTAGDPSDVHDALTPVAPPNPQGYAPVCFPLLPEGVCNELRTAFSAVQRSGKVASVDELGSDAVRFVDTIFKAILCPLYDQVSGKAKQGLDMRYAFVAYYNNEGTATSHVKLPAHSDDSEVTLTLQLGGSWTQGGEVLFRHERSAPQEGSIEASVAHNTTGVALLHSGRHLHEVLPVTSTGDRMVMVIWARSTNHRSTHCPCCTMFDRSRCIMKPDWKTPEGAADVYNI